MRILFITSSRIGDAVLSTGLLNYMVQTYPDAKITIACGPLAVSLFEGCPAVEEIIPLQKQKYNRHWIKLWRRVIGTRWDIVVDLRDSAVSRLIRSQERHVFGKHVPKDMHKVQQNAAVMDLESVPVPRLWFSEAQQRAAESLIPDDGRAVIGVGPTANWIGKTWATENFIEIIHWLRRTGGKYENARVAVFAAPGEELDARKVLEAFPQKDVIDVIAKTSPGEAAATLARCDFYIGNDSGLMHCAAACGVPTFGVFGPSYPHIYSPWGEHCDYARTPETFDELIDFEGYNAKTLDHSLMGSLTPDMVKKKLETFF